MKTQAHIDETTRGLRPDTPVRGPSSRASTATMRKRPATPPSQHRTARRESPLRRHRASAPVPKLPHDHTRNPTMTDRYNRHGSWSCSWRAPASDAPRPRGARARTAPSPRRARRGAALPRPRRRARRQGVPAPTARTLAPHVHRTRARCAIVRIEPRARSPEGPWPGLLDAGPGLFDLSESGVRAFVAELQTAALPDAALPRPVYRLPINASQP